MMVSGKFVVVFLAVMSAVALAPSWAVAQMQTPRLVESVDTKPYRRVVGGPAGAFYFVNKGSFEIATVSAAGLQLRKLRSESKLQASAHGAFFALLDYSSYRPTALEVSQITLHNSAGDLIWRRRALDCNSFVLSDALPLAVGIRGAEGLAETQLLFLGAAGKTIDSAQVDYYTRGRFCGDGSHFFAVSGGKGVLKFNRAGKLTGQYLHGGDYRVSPDAQWLATIADTSIRFHFRETLVGELPIEPYSFRDLLFSPDAGSVAILFKHCLCVLALPSLNEEWRYAPPDQTIRLVALDASDDFSRFLCSGNNSGAAPEERNTKGTIILLDGSGSMIWSDELDYVEWANGYPQVMLNPGASLFSAQTAEELRIYSY